MDLPLSESDRIIAEQNSKRQDAQEAEARQREKDRPQAELRRAWDGVSLWIQFDGSVAHSDTMVETTPDAAIPAITTLYKALAACDLLDRLAELPVGVIGEEMQAWQVAWDILRFAPDNPANAEQLLGSIRRLPFAPTVRDWLCRGFRKVVETDPKTGKWTWHAGGLFGNLTGLGQESPEIDTVESRAQPALESTTAVSGMTWQEAAERLKRLRAQGDRWSSQGKLARQFGCSSGTINKAITKTPELHAWAYPESASTPKAQSFNAVVTDRASQRRDLDPADDAAIREYLEGDLDPDERSFFHSLSPEHQLEFLDDPDKHSRILGRRP